MTDTLIELAYRLSQAEEAFVLATVVWCEKPTSAKPGARAIIQANGQVTGWVGGSCTHTVVLREAVRLLQAGGEGYLLRVGEASPGTIRAGLRAFPMTCSSGGVVDIYLEPHLPRPQLLLVGDSPVIEALDRLAQVLNFAVTHLLQSDLSQVYIDGRTSILVATHGEYDEETLAQALRGPACYVGMVGSKKRAEACRDYLRSEGLTEQQIERLRVPAGLDIGAITPEEIAASILAELVLVSRQERIGTVEGAGSGEEKTETAIDPVCGMQVDVVHTQHHSTLDGRHYYFCCSACQKKFERDPQAYLVAEI